MPNLTPTEAEECFTFVQYLQAYKYKFTHIANEGKFPVQYRVKLRRMGVSSGVPDYMIIHPRGLVFIEMKRTKGGKVSEYQQKWIDALDKCKNVGAYTCYGADQAIQLLENL